MIPTWLVALSALVTAILLFTNKKYVDIRIFAILFMMQFVLYFLFSVLDLEIDVRQFSARLNNVATSLAISVALLIVRFRNGS